MTNEQIQRIANMDPITAKGVGYAMDLWHKTAIAAAQGMITHGSHDAKTIAKMAYDVADAMIDESMARAADKMDDLIKKGSA